ncbi:MAG: Wzz/FepE/Etk N-terminal domain-containing protein [Mucinivorans sp.]
MENSEKEIDLLELVKSVWAQKVKVIKWGAIAALVGLVVAFSIPKQYQTMVKIAPEGANNKSSNDMGGLAAMAGLDMGGGGSKDGISAKLYPQVISSAPFLLEFATIEVEHNKEKISFYDYITKEQKSPWWSYIISAPMKVVGWTMGLFSEKEDDKADTISVFKPSEKQKEYVAALNNLITVDVDKKEGVLNLTTTMQDPMIAAVIADSIMAKLQRYMTDYRTAKTRADLVQNLRMLKEAQANYYHADSVYAASTDRNQNLISQSARIKVDRLSNEKNLAFTVYQQVASQVEMTKMKLQEDTPIATIIEPASVSIRASSPKKLVILIAFAFLGGFAALGVVVAKQLMKKDEQ